MNNCLISVIILSYKNLKYYKGCLNSVLSQTYENIEIILSDDGTPNFIPSEIENYINKNKKSNIERFVVNYNTKNLGVVKNYNNAIRMCHGDYIFYIGIDDELWDENTLRDVIEFFKKNQCLIFTGYRDIYDENMEDFIERLPNKYEVDILNKNNPNCLFKRLLSWNFIAGSCTPFAKKIIDIYGYLDEYYTHIEDWPRYLQLTRDDCNIYFYSRPLIKYRLGGITTNTNAPISETVSSDYRKIILKEKIMYINDNINNKNLILISDDAEIINCISNVLNLNQIQKIIFNNKDNSAERLVDTLKLYDLNDTYIIITDENIYNKISKELDLLGYREFKNYYCLTFDDLILLEYFSEHYNKANKRLDLKLDTNFLELAIDDNFQKEFIKRKLIWITKKMNSKKIIGFGTGGQYLQNQKLFNIDVEYFIDNSLSKHGQVFDSRYIYSPDKLYEENKDNIFIIVFSNMYYKDISKQLINMGLCERENFYCFSSDELRMLSKLY